jgi:hypothetical protein
MPAIPPITMNSPSVMPTIHGRVEQHLASVHEGHESDRARDSLQIAAESPPFRF